jgi:hypothetical protein
VSKTGPAWQARWDTFREAVLLFAAAMTGNDKKFAEHWNRVSARRETAGHQPVVPERAR